MVTSQHIYSAEEAVRQLVREAESVNNMSVEFLQSTVTLESVARFSGSHALSHAISYTHAVAQREALTISAEAMTEEQMQSTHFAALHKKNRIWFNRNAKELDQLMVLHEIAHELTGRAHNDLFVSAYLDLVERYIGPGISFVLQYEILSASNKSRSR